MVTLSGLIGAQKIRGAEIVVPTSIYNDRSVNLETLKKIGAAFCDQLGMVSSRISLQEFTCQSGESPVEWNESTGEINVSDFLLTHEQDSVATLLGFISLLWLNDLPDGTIFALDKPWMSDLTPVLFGRGILGANTTIYEYNHSDGLYEYSAIQRPR